MEPVSQAELERRLLTYFREKFSTGDIDYIQPPSLYREGRTLRTYQFRLTGVPKEYSKMLVLRLYSADEIAVRSQFEGLVLNELKEQGFPVPGALMMETSTAYLNAPFLIMEEIRGEVLFDMSSIFHKPYMQAARFMISGVGSIARELAQLAIQLHRIKTDKIIGKLESLKFPLEHLTLNGRLYQLYKRVQNANLTELEPGVIWLISHGPPDPVKPSLCHGQFYPNNVRKLHTTVTGVINWSMDSILFGDATYDVGRTSAAFKCIVPNVSSSLRKLTQPIGKRFANQFIQNYRQNRTISKEKIQYYEMLWCIDTAATAGEAINKKSYVFKKEFDEAKIDLFKTAASAIEYFRNTTGVSIMLPLLGR